MAQKNKRKKKILIIANGWNSENLFNFSRGLTKAVSTDRVDFFMFVSHAVYNDNDTEFRCRNSIFDLPNPSKFDAAILFGPGLNFTEVIKHIIKKLEKSGIPVVSVGIKHPGFHYIGVDNYTGMYDLCEHLIEKHDVSSVFYIAGSKENDDSNIRLSAIKDCLEKHDLIFDNKQILYTDWSAFAVYSSIINMAKDGYEFPDAIVCANDTLAEMASYAFEESGYEIGTPIITGFDYLDDGKGFYPSIASVDQRFDAIGEKAFEILSALFRGETTEEDVTLECRFCPGESCGCNTIRNDDSFRRIRARKRPLENIITDLYDGRFYELEREIIHSVDLKDMRQILYKNFEKVSGRETESFYIMLDPSFEDIVADDISALPQYKYSKTMNVLVGKKNGESTTTRQFKTSELLPDYDAYDENHMYFFTPIYYESFVCGYIVMVDFIEWLKSMTLYLCENRLNRAVASFRRNLQLTLLNEKMSELMEKDSLTFVKNRTAYDRKIAAVQNDIKDGVCPSFSIICFDLNDLKTVNDQLGHEEGDEYIKKCCSFICNTFKHSPIYRIGGDEFIALLMGTDYKIRHKLLDDMRDKMLALLNRKHELSISECISIASGMADYDPDSPEDYMTLFKRADDRMYQNKYFMKNGAIR
ncbi:MAG: diguanylate cyclase [Lachnospiraceae bacterium]|nr:diguanylate cyclase [Lachnospiraceae bacterium]